MINRRDFLLSISLLPSYISSALSKNISKNAHVVVVGAGWGGLSAAKTLRYLSEDLKITVIEKENKFISCPISNWVIGQIKDIKDITFSFKNFIKYQNINFINDELVYIDASKKLLFLKNKKIRYDKLIISTGIEMDFKSIQGLEKAYDGKEVVSAWKAGKETIDLAKRIANLENGNDVIISIPLSPYRCPPGPYERASLIADHIKNKKLNSKVIILDANQKIISKGSLFKKAWDDYYRGIIEYHPDSKVIEINAEEKKVFTDFDEFNYHTANIIPEQRAPNILKDSGLIEENKKWVKVDPYDFSTRYSDIHVIGDSTDRHSVGAVPKSGYVANSMGKAVAFSVYFSFLEKIAPEPSIINTCYSLVSRKEGISVSAVYKYNKEIKKIVSVKGATGTSPKRSSVIANNAWDWARAIWSDMLT